MLSTLNQPSGGSPTGLNNRSSFTASRARRSWSASSRLTGAKNAAARSYGRYLDPVLSLRFSSKTLIGRGGCAEVYAAHDIASGERVALKLLHRGTKGTIAADAAARMRREADLLARISELGHPSLPRLHARSLNDSCDPWLSLELIEGITLADYIGRGAISLTRAITWIRDLADALAACHSVGVIHRDLKPGNIILSSTIKLIDWGIAHDVASDVRVTEIGMVAGTPRYMSPEQAQDHPTSAPTDVYSLGVTAYELLTGDVPFTSTSSLSVALCHVIEDPAPLALGDSPTAALIESLVMSMLSKNAAHRPTMVEVREGCDAALAELALSSD